MQELLATSPRRDSLRAARSPRRAMRVLDARAGVLTNFELAELLRQQQQARDEAEALLPLPGARRGASTTSTSWQAQQHVALISEQVLGYLDANCTAVTRPGAAAFIENVVPFDLTRTEVRRPRTAARTIAPACVCAPAPRAARRRRGTPAGRRAHQLLPPERRRDPPDRGGVRGAALAGGGAQLARAVPAAGANCAAGARGRRDMRWGARAGGLEPSTALLLFFERERETPD